MKLWWQKRTIFLQMHNIILQKVKKILNAKMINPEKSKQEKCQLKIVFLKNSSIFLFLAKPEY